MQTNKIANVQVSGRSVYLVKADAHGIDLAHIKITEGGCFLGMELYPSARLACEAWCARHGFTLVQSILR